MVGASVSGLPAERERIGLDTNIFIYFLEDHPRYGSWCASLFDLIERGHNPAVTSTVTLLELLVQPYRDQKEELAQKIFALTSTYPKLEWLPVTMDVADRAAELRARYRLREAILELKGNPFPHDADAIDRIDQRLRLRLQYVSDQDSHTVL